MIVARNSSVTTTRTVAVNNLDKSVVLSPLDSWGSSNQGNGITGGTFSFSNAENATAVFRFPRASYTYLTTRIPYQIPSQLYLKSRKFHIVLLAGFLAFWSSPVFSLHRLHRFSTSGTCRRTRMSATVYRRCREFYQFPCSSS